MKRISNSGEERVINYLRVNPDALTQVLRVLHAYIGEDISVNNVIKSLKNNPLGEVIAEATYRYRTSHKNGLKRVLIDEEKPNKWKVDPYFAMSVAEAGRIFYLKKKDSP